MRLGIDAVHFLCSQQKGNRFFCLSCMDEIDAQEKIGNIQSGFKFASLLKALNGSGVISGFVFHKSKVRPQLRNIGANLDSLLVLSSGRCVVAAGLGFLRLSQQRLERGVLVLLAHPKLGSDQQNQRKQYRKNSQAAITSRTFLRIVPCDWGKSL